MNEQFLLREALNHGITQLIAMMLTIFFIPRLWVTSIIGAIAIVAAISIVNATFWDESIFYSIPNSFTVSSLKLFFANGVLFWILVFLVPGIQVRGILPALVAPIIFSIISSVIHNYASHLDWINILQLFFEWLVSIKESFVSKNPG